MLLVSLFGAALVTTVSAVVVRTIIQRGASRLDPGAHSFGVWEEDARQRRKNLRRK
jgi:hypothetical protein